MTTAVNNNMAEPMCDVVKMIAKLPREEGCQMLIDLLRWKSFAANDLAQSICLDCIYDSVVFCVNNSFTSTEVSCVIKLVHEMLKAAEWRGLVGAVIHYRSFCNETCSHVDQQRLLAFTEFFFSTFMKHYRLYRCVMSTSPLRENISSSLVLPVEVPPRLIQPLNKGMDPEVWDYEQAVCELEKMREEMQKKRRAEKYDQEKEEAQKLAEAQCRVSDLGDPVDSEKVLQIINEAADIHINVASRAIQRSIAETMDEITFALDKASLPRPAALDPAPQSDTKKTGSPKDKKK